MSDDVAAPVHSVSEGSEVVVSINEKYNFSGDQICTIQTENTLFKIHRYLLIRESTVFKDMFDLPRGESTIEQDGAEVIQLPDSTRAFSTLCWALYALPMDLIRQCDPHADVGRLIELARIANKYQFRSLEEWSLYALEKQCSEHDFLQNSPYDAACDILSVASTCSSQTLQKVVEYAIVTRPDLTEPDVQVPWKEILSTFNQFGTRRFRGLIYYRLLHAVETSGYELDEETNDPRPIIPLCAEDINRLRRGCWATTKFWSAFACSLAQSKGCPDHQKCLQAWKSFVLEKCSKGKDGLFINPTHLITKVKRGQVLLRESAWRNLDAHDSCVTLAQKTLAQKEKQLTDGMDIFFLGPTSSSESEK